MATTFKRASLCLSLHSFDQLVKLTELMRSTKSHVIITALDRLHKSLIEDEKCNPQ